MLNSIYIVGRKMYLIAKSMILYPFLPTIINFKTGKIELDD